ncbi:MAG TPA: RnfABCDGE type electron transport complex subunit D [Gemmatimonas sp.]|uniref:RnfABCDGE type electron transport complex subunit D n=1 Tax=Gemmatimonas sp. TaxID=1962908 RepID=UPI002EDB49F3
MTSHLRADWPHLLRWLRSPKGLFAGVLLVLTIPAVWHAGWSLVWPSLLAAMLTAAVCDVPLLRWRDGDWSVPDGALLTGWLIALVLSPHQPWHVAAAASIIGIGAKHALRVKRANVLNPAAAGVVATYFLFGSGQSWWGALPELPTPWIALLLATGAFMTWRLHKTALALSFLGVYYLIATALAFVDPAKVVALYRAPDVHMALFFAGFMATDPPTSPPRYGDQLKYGALAAVVSMVLYMTVGAVYFLLGGLLVANLWEGWRKWQHARQHRRPTAATPVTT